jgi:hypothetical protein
MDEAYIIKWYGPFPNKDEVRKWEKLHDDIVCNLYLLHGMKKHAKTIESYYCGKTLQYVYERFQDKSHHLYEICNREHEIYIGQISNIEPDNDDVLKLEKMITAFIGYHFEERNVLNKINFHPPHCDGTMSIVNQWYKQRDLSQWQRLPKSSPANIIPDVMVYRENDDHQSTVLYGIQKLKYIWK